MLAYFVTTSVCADHVMLCKQFQYVTRICWSIHSWKPWDVTTKERL